MMRSIKLYILAFCLIVPPAITRGETISTFPGPLAPSIMPSVGYFEPELPGDSVIFWPTVYGVQQTGVISTSFDCYGIFGLRMTGHTAYDWWPYPSFESPPGNDVEYLFGGSIWVGGIVNGDTLVSEGSDQFTNITDRRDLAPPNGLPNVTRFDYPTGYSMRAMFSDTASKIDSFQPLGIEIANRSHVFFGAPFNKTIVYDMTITNVGSDPIEKGFAGLYFDCDIGNALGDDLAGSIRDQGIVYMIDRDGNPVGNSYDESSANRIFAVKFLKSSFLPADTNFNWWTGGFAPWLVFGPRRKDTATCTYSHGGLGLPVTNYDKYCLLSFPEWDYDQIYTRAIDSTDEIWMYPDQTQVVGISDGHDTRFTFSIGPFDLLPDSSIRIMYSMFTGEWVHYDPQNFINNILLNYRPGSYRAGLNFSDVLNVSYWSDVLADSLLNPNYPPIGLRVSYSDFDSTVISWDPWVFEDVSGYEIYLNEIPPEQFPYPGVPAPWLVPDNPALFATVGRWHRYNLDFLQPNKVYSVSIANLTAEGRSTLSSPVMIVPREHYPAIVTESQYLFVPEGFPSILPWDDISGEDIDHYNIYRFDNGDQADDRFYPFYDRGQSLGARIAVDTFDVDGNRYYYYALPVFSQVPTNLRTFINHSVVDGEVYVVTAVNTDGFESSFSAPVSVQVVDPPSKEFLVIANTNQQFVEYQVIAEFYDSVLAGFTPAYDYDIYNFQDTVTRYGSVDSIDWTDFARYRILIIDDDIRDWVILDNQEREYQWFTKYMQSGGKMAYFGSLNGLTGQVTLVDSGHFALDQPFIESFFGVDSIFYCGIGFFVLNNLPMEDSLFGFIGAVGTGPKWPSIDFDSSRFPYGSDFLAQLWPGHSGPATVTFTPSVDASPIYKYRSRNPSGSFMQDGIVGVHLKREKVESWLFGFHLWYMDHLQARELIESLLPLEGCCDLAGDVDHKGGIISVDLLDVLYLIDYLFRNDLEPVCFDEADLNVDGTIDIIDASILMDYLFRAGFLPDVCQ